MAGIPAVRVDGVEKAYEDGGRAHVVLRGASLAVWPGEVVALTGPSGSGKSTLLNIVGGIDTADRGRVEVAGVDITALSERARTLVRRSRIGFVFQFFNLVPTLTVEENVVLPLELNGVSGAAAAAQALSLLERVGLDRYATRFPDELSGGEQQRVAIARAVAHGPQLLLADEPTGNLDAATGAATLDLLEQLVRGTRCALLLVTHNADVVARADRVLVLRDGRIGDAA